MGKFNEETIRSIYDCWNDGNKDGVIAAFRDLGPAGFTVEYVGEAPLDGMAAVEDMWENYAGTCTTDVVELLVNGNEAAALIQNNVNSDAGVTSLPSIETYHLKGNKLVVRYFHQAPEGSYLKE